MSSRDSGPTRTTCTRSCGNAGRTPRGSTSPSDPRTAVSTPIGSSRDAGRRTATRGRTADPSTARHRWPRRRASWTPRRGSNRGRPGRWPAGRRARRCEAIAGVPPREPLAAARGASPGSRPGWVRRGRRGPRTTDASRPRRDSHESVRYPRSRAPPAPPPHRGLPDARIPGQQRGGRAGRDRIEDALSSSVASSVQPVRRRRRPMPLPRWWTSGFYGWPVPRRHIRR